MAMSTPTPMSPHFLQTLTQLQRSTEGYGEHGPALVFLFYYYIQGSGVMSDSFVCYLKVNLQNYSFPMTLKSYCGSRMHLHLNKRYIAKSSASPEHSANFVQLLDMNRACMLCNDESLPALLNVRDLVSFCH